MGGTDHDLVQAGESKLNLRSKHEPGNCRGESWDGARRHGREQGAGVWVSPDSGLERGRIVGGPRCSRWPP